MMSPQKVADMPGWCCLLCLQHGLQNDGPTKSGQHNRGWCCILCIQHRLHNVMSPKVDNMMGVVLSSMSTTRVTE